ncbi:MAG: GNAT family N-acetyltransferase [Clostridium argentinense]|uniref:GNAT family N-acetyltransferase n=1 Tax=uncultured Clostridium sp. TaxID=59620 RepID=UPI001DC8A4E7|nr:GNAT family N-acetyltransferase [uncultured Clostridium sp.]MBS5822880.1 GNAT family N-acetyltransferase [Clostridium argentinense]MDU1349107.1 GNAT family N-acetyltransferase [Clostridium argentinense]
MVKVKILTNEIKETILKFLYEEEEINLFIIHFIENDNIGDLYVDNEDNIGAVLHIKDDGNSLFTNFYYDNKKNFETIIKEIEKLKSDRMLLAAKEEDVAAVLKELNIGRNIDKNFYYIFDDEKKLDLQTKEYSFKRATFKDRSFIKETYIDFFGATSEEDINSLTNDEKIKYDLKNGVYLLWKEDTPVGLAKFSEFSRNFGEITTVYIKNEYRGRGLGKILMSKMVERLIEIKKIPITQVNVKNLSAKHIYESIGFKKYCNYAFEFLND